MTDLLLRIAVGNLLIAAALALVAWARRNLRRNEEVCCDALVLFTRNPNPRTYASSLLAVVEFLSAPALRPPAMASGVNSGGFLERRLEMIVSANPLAPTPRWLRAALLVGVLAILPLGIAQADEPDYEAVGDRLEEAVRVGELSADQAAGMMGELARARFAERMAGARGRGRTRPEMAAMREKLGAAVRAGKLSEEDAKAKWKAYVEKLGSGKRVGKGERDQGLEGHFRRLGVDGETLAGIRKHLVAGGLSEEKAEMALGGLLRVVHLMKEEGESFQPDPRMHEYFKEEVGLSDGQMEEGLGLARRILHGMRSRGARGKGTPTREEMAKVKEELGAAVEAGKLSEEDARKRWEGYLQRFRGGETSEAGATEEPTPAEMAAERARLGGAVKNGLISEEDAQKLWEGYLERVRGGAEKARGDKPTREEAADVGRRIRAAVEAGEMTPEQGRARMAAYLSGLRSGASRERGDTPTREEMGKVKERIWAAVEAGRISEEDAQKRWEGYIERVRGGAQKARGETPTREEMAKVKERIWEGVKAGKLSEEDAKAKWEAYLKSLESRRR